MENLSNDELLSIIRKAENVGVPTSQYKKAKTEWDIRHQKAMLEAAKSNRPAFIGIAPGAKVDSLKMKGNTLIGNADFIRNEGELKNANLKNNKHIVDPELQNIGSSSINWTKWGTILTLLGIIVAVIIAI